MDESSEFQQQIDSLIDSALKLDPVARTAFLDRACAGNPSLRRRIESRLTAGEKPSTDPPPSRRSKPQPEVSVAIGEIISHYKILSFLGRGGMGEVYLAQDLRLGRKVALKLLPKALIGDEERLRRFEREARSASVLTHPNVCVIHEIGETNDNRPYISMEYIDGQTLRRRYSRGALKLTDAMAIAQQTASALAAAHAAGIVHRDIKPENIMLRRDGYVKVLDFGLAKLTERYDAGSDSEAPTFNLFSTHSGVLLGTTNYLSPEQARRLDVDERADIWALGVVLFEMVAGRLPFTGETPSHVIVSILEKEPEPLTQFLPGVPPELEWIVKKALRKDREHRYQTVKELLSDLDEVKKKISDAAASGAEQMTSQVQTQPSARHSSALQSISENLRRPRLSLAFFLVVMMAVLVAGWFIFQRIRSNSKPLFQNLEVIKLTNSGNITDANISPDGKYVAYVVDDLGKQSLWTRHVPTATSLMIAAAEDVRYQGLTFSKDSNYIYYVRQEKDQIGTLYQVPVFGTGTVRKLANHVDSAVTFSPDGQQLAFVRAGPSKTKLLIAKPDGSDERELASGDKTEGFTSPSWSPDNKMIAYGVATFAGGFHMTLVATTLTGEQKIISSRRWYSIRRLAWLGDNSGLVIDASEQPYGVFQLWQISYPDDRAERITNDVSNYPALGLTANGEALVTVKSDRSTNIWVTRINDPGKPRKLISGVGNYFGVSWFPDGRIAYSSMASGNPELWLINSDGSGDKQLTANNGANYHPAVSPDGRYIAFTCYRGGVFKICRMDADGNNQMELTQGDGASFPYWSPDGQWVYYDVLSSGTAALWRVRADGREATAVTDHYSRGPVISPDGRRIGCTYWDDQAKSLKYAVLPIGGGPPVKLFGSPDPNRQRMPRWTSDSQSLLYVDTSDGGTNILLQPLTSGEPRAVTNFESDRIFDFDLAPDGKQLVFTRGAAVSDVVLIRGLKKSS